MRFQSIGLVPAATSLRVFTLLSLVSFGAVIAEFNDAGLGDVAAGELAGDAALAHDQDPVGEDGQFLDIRGDQDDADAGAGEGADGAMDLFARPDVHAA